MAINECRKKLYKLIDMYKEDLYELIDMYKEDLYELIDMYKENICKGWVLLVQFLDA